MPGNNWWNYDLRFPEAGVVRCNVAPLRTNPRIFPSNSCDALSFLGWCSAMFLSDHDATFQHAKSSAIFMPAIHLKPAAFRTQAIKGPI